MTQRWEQSETDEEDRRIYGASCQRWELIDYSRQDPQIVDTTFTTPEKKDQ